MYRSIMPFLIWLWPLSLLSQSGGTPKQQERYRLQLRQTTDRIQLDGRLTESIWQEADVAQDFWMSFPVDDRRADPEMQTEVRVLCDKNTLYLGVTCLGPSDYIIPTLKRDTREFWGGDVFAVLIDPVNEASNGFSFAVNPAGVQYESLISGRTGTRAEMNSRSSGNSAFNTAWDNRWVSIVAQEADRWTIEIAIPFKTLRFDPEKTTWGINFTRGEPRSNSWHTWAPVPVQFLTMDLGYTGALDWDQPPGKVKSNISVIPYVLGSTNKDFEEGTEGEVDFRTGLDAKVAVTSSLNLDVTINPDFSQVEVDEQVTNLTTFNVRFPERRLFFLENSDLFSDFGIPPMRPFFSRRIGLDDDGNSIPILYGLRLSGNLNEDLRLGLMNMHTRAADEHPAQNYTSLALQQQVMERSVVKGYFHNRQGMDGSEIMGDDYNRTAGLEFKYLSQDAKWQAFSGYGQSFSDGLKGDNYFYNIGGGYDGRHISAYTNLAGIGDNYYADMGWIPFSEHYDAVRDTSIHVGFQHLYSRFSYTFYPIDPSKVQSRQLGARNVLDLDNDLSLLQNRFELNYLTNFANTSRLAFEYGHEDQRLLFPFDFTDAEPLPAGRYAFDYASLMYSSDYRKFFSWRAGLQYGSFYNGTRLETSLWLRYRVQPWGNFAVNLVYNKLEFPDPYGAENLVLIGPRIEFNFTKNLFWTTFLQYNTQKDNFNINSRFQWRFKPLSDIFLVYSDNYAVEVWGPKSRTLVLKMNYWLNL